MHFINERNVMQRLGVKHGGYRFGSHRSIWGNAGKTRERLRAMTGLRNRLPYPVDSSYAYDAARAIGDDRLMIRMCLQRQRLRAVSLYEYIFGKICQFGEQN